MLRISETETRNGHLILRLEGRIAGPWIEEVQKICERCLSEGRGIRLRMTEVSFVDRAGIALLLTLMKRGVALDECPPFIAEEMKTNETAA
jgi:anti-anti-sigma factor